MPISKEYDVYFSLAGITCHENGQVTAILKIANSKYCQSNQYIEFVFNSLDLLFHNLRTLAQIVNSHSINNLRLKEYPAKIITTKSYNSPEKFFSFILSNNRNWPCKNYSAHFLYDTLE